MKKYTRQRLILDLIEENEIRTQEELSDYLEAHGVRATQATISRDIKELRISKVQTREGEYHYAIIDTVHDSLNERLDKIFRSAVLTIKHNEDMVIIKTISHTATVCGMAITNAKLDNIAGILTGNDTIYITVEDKSGLEKLVSEIKSIIR
ncbi:MULTISPECIES: arginine repressor [Finegoldia]|jgi:arginine repressor|uniref:Arginine repressor n=5 Tax=Finegoldia TaxID=150022 RepID=ARGR_FINM2|nr:MULTISPECIES: arginine repressor [Finegoldia]B0S1L6.1 RecName: Full=Arginine repressor [Finegoldia magna ATCC 29328]MDU2201498.1 arginine repressor [Anaerococcus hydrogenalis]EFH92611.1 arginine repressor, C-terminal domain protein [Finegoldia magna ATCC 53516]EFK93679.1 arginine repressor, C-terminal domain protein [Finegoldia magna ACS-171-V-Col3]EFL54830.1 arginine repressor, C-terminal domain protein [Finegoldia magna BVS033A4]EGS32704.1 arginine repressor, C-terminal domain protein [F